MKRVSDKMMSAVCAVAVSVSLLAAGQQVRLSDAKVLFRDAQTHLAAECTPAVFSYHYAKIHAQDPEQARFLAILYCWLVEDPVIRATIYSTGG